MTTSATKSLLSALTVALGAAVFAPAAQGEEAGRDVLRLICLGKEFDPSGQEQGATRMVVLDQLSAENGSGSEILEKDQIKKFRDIPFRMVLFTGNQLEGIEDWNAYADDLISSKVSVAQRIERPDALGKLLLGKFNVVSRGNPFFVFTLYTSNMGVALIAENSKVTAISCQPPIFTPAPSN